MSSENMLDLNNPIDARIYIGEMIAAGFQVVADQEDYRYLPDDRALYIASRFFLQVIPPYLRGNPH